MGSGDSKSGDDPLEGLDIDLNVDLGAIPGGTPPSARRQGEGDGYADLQVGQDNETAGTFKQAQKMDAAPIVTSMHKDAQSPEDLRRNAPRKRRTPAPLSREQPANEEATLDRIVASRPRRRRGPALGMLAMVGLIGLLCTGVVGAGAGLWFSGIGQPDEPTEVADPEGIDDPVNPDEPDAPDHVGSRERIPVEKGLRNNNGTPEPEPTRPDVPTPED